MADPLGSGVMTSESVKGQTASSPNPPARDGFPTIGKPAEFPQVSGVEGQTPTGTDVMIELNTNPAN